MAWRCSGSTNAELIDNLVKGNIIKHQAVADAMKAVDRANYCLDKKGAYTDSPQSIGYGATISAPHMHAMCLELLLDNLKPGAKVLDVGSGSGYLVACMAHMVKPNGFVYGVEHIPQLVDFAKANIARDKKELFKTAEIRGSDGRMGLADVAPFDCIHVGAAAETVPDALRKQLKVGGRLVIPVGSAGGNQDLQLIYRKSDTEWNASTVCGVVYVPLTDKSKQLNN